MTPEDLARNLARSTDLRSRALGVAMIVRGLTDHDPSDPFRQGWPLSDATAARAAEYLGLNPDRDLVAEALRLAPTVSDALLNRRRNGFGFEA